MILEVPDGVAPESYFAALVVSALMVAVGTSTLFLTLVLFVRTSGQVAHPERFTKSGRFLIHPEHEALFFLATCMLALALAIAQTIRWNRWLRMGHPVPPPVRDTIAWAAVGAVGSLAGALGFLGFLYGRHYVLRHQPIPRIDLVALLAVAASCAVVGAVGAKSRFAWPPRSITASESFGLAQSQSRDSTRLGICDVLVPLLVIALLFVPAWRILAGRVYQVDNFIHWDYFAMGATTAYSHGGALGTQVHTQYGAGWPLLFGLLRPLLAVSYGHMILVASVTGCVYFIGVYMLLRLTTQRALWATAGTLLALLLQVFSGNFQSVTSTTLHFPNISVLRRPLDVWVFLALALHLRTRGTGWAVAAGGLTGLALVFATDTGLCLAAAVALCWACIWISGGRPQVRPIVASAVAAAGVFLALEAVASRGGILSVAFWKAWYEPLSQGAGGYTALPIVGRADLWGATIPPPAAMAAVFAIAVIYLTLVCHLVIKALHRRAGPMDLFIGCVSAYGLLSLVNFIGRSEAHEIPHLLVPFVIVVTTLAARSHRHLTAVVRPPRRTPRLLSLIPVLLIVGLAIMLVVNPSVGDYPGVLQTLPHLSPPDGRCMFNAPRDVCGLPDPSAADVQEFQLVTAEMRRLAANGRVALIDYQARYSVAAPTAPIGPYAPMLPVLFEQRQVVDAGAQLLRDRPTYVFIRPPAIDPVLADVAEAFQSLLQGAYTVDHSVGSFQIYKLR